MAKNSAINIHNEDNTKSIKLDIDDSEAAGDYGSSVTASLTDLENGYNTNINAVGGFTHTTDDGLTSNLNGYGLSVNGNVYNAQITSD